MLKRNLPSRKQTLIGAAAIVLATGAVAAVAWAAQPKRVVATYADSPEIADLMDEADLLGELDGEFDIDLSGGGTIVLDGEVVRVEDLTPEQREELRQTLAEAREQVRDAQREMAAARQAIRDALHYGPSEEEMESIREAIAEARLSQEEGRRERLEALAEARQAMREAQVELAAARIAMRDMPDMREALREAEVEIARAIRESRANGDRVRAEALEGAAAAIEAQLRAAGHADVEVNADYDADDHEDSQHDEDK